MRIALAAALLSLAATQAMSQDTAIAETSPSQVAVVEGAATGAVIVSTQSAEFFSQQAIQARRAARLARRAGQTPPPGAGPATALPTGVAANFAIIAPIAGLTAVFGALAGTSSDATGSTPTTGN